MSDAYDELEQRLMEIPTLVPSESRAIMARVRKYTLQRPLYEDGEPVQFGGEFTDGKKVGNVRRFILREDGWTVDSKPHTHTSVFVEASSDAPQGVNHVKRPAVLDADGVEIKLGDTVWLGSDELIVTEIDENGRVSGDYPEFHCAKPVTGVGRISPSDLTHTPPDSREKVINDLSNEAFCLIVQAGEGVRGVMLHTEKYISRIDALVKAGRWSE